MGVSSPSSASATGGHRPVRPLLSLPAYWQNQVTIPVPRVSDIACWQTLVTSSCHLFERKIISRYLEFRLCAIYCCPNWEWTIGSFHEWGLHVCFEMNVNCCPIRVTRQELELQEELFGRRHKHAPSNKFSPASAAKTQTGQMGMVFISMSLNVYLVEISSGPAWWSTPLFDQHKQFCMANQMRKQLPGRAGPGDIALSVSNVANWKQIWSTLKSTFLLGV